MSALPLARPQQRLMGFQPNLLMDMQNDKPLRRDVLQLQPLALHLQVLTQALQAECQALGYEFDTGQIIDQSALQVDFITDCP